MAITISTNLNLGTTHFETDDLDSTAQQIKEGTSTLFSFEIDNSDNEDPCYVKAWNTNAAAAPSVGTTVPNLALKVAGGKVRRHVVNGGKGQTWATGIFVACVTTPGTAGSAAPTNAVGVKIWTS